MKNMTKQEFIASIRRNSSGFSRGASINRGVTRHHQHGRWQARMVELQEIRISTLGHFVDLNASAPAPHINSSNRNPSGSPSSGNKSFDPLMIIVPGLFFISIALLLFYFRAIRKTQAKKNKVEEDRKMATGN